MKRAAFERAPQQPPSAAWTVGGQPATVKDGGQLPAVRVGGQLFHIIAESSNLAHQILAVRQLLRQG